MLAIVRVYLYRRAFDARLAGVLAGCAMGVKYNAVMLVLPPLPATENERESTKSDG